MTMPAASGSPFSSLTVIKRDGRRVPFDEGKIRHALLRAGQATQAFDYPMATRLAAEVTGRLLGRTPGEAVSVEQIQDEVEATLFHAGQLGTARAYIIYREKRRAARADRRIPWPEWIFRKPHLRIVEGRMRAFIQSQLSARTDQGAFDPHHHLLRRGLRTGDGFQNRAARTVNHRF